MRFTVIHRAENLSFTHTIFLSILYTEQATNITYTLEDVEETLRSIKRLWYSLTDQSEGICRFALPFEIILYNYSGKKLLKRGTEAALSFVHAEVCSEKPAQKKKQ